MEGISERRVARDLANAILKNRISEFEHISVDMLISKYGLVVNPELNLVFIPDSPRGRTGLSLNKLPKDLVLALVEKEKADANMVNLPCWVSDDNMVVKDKRHYLLFSINGQEISAVKVEVTTSNKSKIEQKLGKKLNGITKYVIPRRAAISLCEKYSKETTE